MPVASLRRLAACAGLACGTLPSPALADPPPAALGRPTPEGLHPVSPRPLGQVAGNGDHSGWMWRGTIGIALALAAIGWIGVASRRCLPRDRDASGELKVIGRVRLAPGHAVHLLRAGDRVLVIGTGPGGAPALLGEWPEGAVAPRPGPDRPIGGGA
jgi:hypothetical protein